MKLNEFINEENGYVKDGKAQIEMIVKAKTMDKMTRKRYVEQRGYFKKDIRIGTTNQSVPASSTILAEKSAYFYNAADDSLKDVKIDATHEETLLFLELICNCGRPFKDEIVGGILKLCAEYRCPVEIQQCEKYIIESTTIPMMQKLIYADTYHLERLKNNCLYEIKMNNLQQELINNKEYDGLGDKIRLEILETEKKDIQKPDVYMIKGVIRDFKQPRGWLTDTILVLDGVEFHVSHQMLAWESEVFDELLWNAKNKRDTETSTQSASSIFGNMFQSTTPVPVKPPPLKIEIENFTFEELDEFLQMIYQPTNYVTCSNFKSMLELSHRYKVWFILGKCQQYLIDNPYIELIDKLVYAGKYELDKLTDHCLTKINSIEDAKDLRATGRLGEVNEDVAKKLLMKITQLL